MPAVLGLVHEIPVTAQPGMQVPARIYADDELWEQIGGDRSLGQLRNVATLPGVTGAVYGMPDMHEGYGFPVGGVAAMRLSDGVISPGGVGYDINCGVRLLVSGLRAERIRAKLPDLVHEISRSVPSGAGRGGRVSFSDTELDRVFVEGCRYLAERGLTEPDDLEVIEAGGCLPGADPAAVREVQVVSDLQRSALAVGRVTLPPGVRVQALAARPAPPNRGITSARVTAGAVAVSIGGATAGGPVPVTLRVRDRDVGRALAEAGATVTLPVGATGPGWWAGEVVLPPDERPMSKHNGNAFRLDGGDDGREEFSGDIFLLPYWLGRYLGVIRPTLRP